MKKLPLIIMFGVLILNSCGSTSTPFPTVTVMPQPTMMAIENPTETSTPDPTPVPSDGKPSVELLNLSVTPYAKVWGLKTQQVIDRLVQVEIQGIDGKNYQVIVDPGAIANELWANTPLLINEKGVWETTTLKSISQLSGIEIGTGVSQGDNNDGTDLYNANLSKQFDSFYISDDVNEQYWHYGGVDKFVNLAIKNNLPIRFTGVFFHGDTYDKEKFGTGVENVKKYWDYRFRKILPYIKDNHDKIKMSITFVDEPFFAYNGQILWIGSYVESGDLKPYKAYYDAYGKNWIIEAYVDFYNLAVNEFGIVPGKDFEVVGITNVGLELPGLLHDYTAKEIVRMKKEIGKRLNISWEQVPFDIGEEWQIGDNIPKEGVWRVASYLPDKINKDVVRESILDMANKTQSSIYIIGMDSYSKDNDLDSLSRAFSAICQGAIESGVVPSISLFKGMNFSSHNDPWPTETIFNSPDFSPSKLYYSLLKGLFEQ